MINSALCYARAMLGPQPIAVYWLDEPKLEFVNWICTWLLASTNQETFIELLEKLHCPVTTIAFAQIQ